MQSTFLYTLSFLKLAAHLKTSVRYSLTEKIVNYTLRARGFRNVASRHRPRYNQVGLETRSIQGAAKCKSESFQLSLLWIKILQRLDRRNLSQTSDRRRAGYSANASSGVLQNEADPEEPEGDC